MTNSSSQSVKRQRLIRTGNDPVFSDGNYASSTTKKILTKYKGCFERFHGGYDDDDSGSSSSSTGGSSSGGGFL
ncbi:hypothetical protein M0802_006535 [Mischocyttarus mexicanus]|nr:hypothetical protein M0802_006535 [Mischocyttarus mexicanus]